MWKLAIFDFDNTVVNLNVYSLIDDLLSEKVPDNLSEIEKAFGWIARMNALFESNCLNEQKVRNVLDKILIDDKMITFMKDLFENGYEIIIISDSNTYFINYILEANRIREYVREIYANVGCFTEAGFFKLIGLNEVMHGNKFQFDCQIGLNRCAPNVCKRLVLQYHTEKHSTNQKNKHFIYVGDGLNDFCPALILNKTDVFCVRKGYALEKVFIKNENFITDKINSNVVFWNDGDDLARLVKN